MTERHRPGVRGVEDNPQSYLGGIFVLAVSIVTSVKGFSEQNLAMIGAGALIYGGFEGARWFLNKRRERSIAPQ